MPDGHGTPAPADPLLSSRYESLTGTVESPFPEYDAPPPEPHDLAQRWLADAEQHGAREPRSIALATADDRGRVSNRIVTVIELSARGLLFTSHTTSLKARDLAANGWASAAFYWREISRQLLLSGAVRRIHDAECDALWEARPVALHAMTTASRQSEPLGDVEGLRSEALRLGTPGVALPRPERFVGYLLEPAEVEFWSARPDRLHRRLRYERTGHVWQCVRLQP
ncbi:phenazine biosynthesis FMN-dependent oxidase PhzG [Streptomonospora salina]|uniref:Pyridoxamine 5'-phosphate oxidase n=1 Tax=Streptomonospora salina TaxID=104205 RepID=A0A841EKT5_9ACTN|nr:phenazine biosynthesis FMN-dependent oxidase PhzG [Streptomonospora salina]MBB6000021.1 pyridoxamine 5'-phosphate oxidase [Streptomonospora salina]